MKKEMPAWRALARSMGPRPQEIAPLLAPRSVYAHSVVLEESFVPHTPDPELWDTAIVYAVRLDYFGKMLKKDQQRLIEVNPRANKRAGDRRVTPGSGLLRHRALRSRNRATAPRESVLGSFGPVACRQGDDACTRSAAWS